MTKTAPAISVSKLSKQFEDNLALDKISLDVKRKKITALIGPNGSGKTTLIKILVGLHSATSGSAKILGHDIALHPTLAKRQLGYIPDNPSGFDYLSGYELLGITASFHKINSFKLDTYQTRLAQAFNLTPILDDRLANYSRGSRQKLALLTALVGQPKLLIIDEPLVGLDPDSIEIFGQALKHFTTTGGTVFFSTHILEFAKRFAEHVVVLHQGHIKLNEKITNKTSLTRYYNKLTT